MDYLWIVIAFFFGFAVKQINLPPLVGYLLAGFALNAFGYVPDGSLETLANLGVTLLLFTIGLKINISTLIKPEVLFTAIGHTLIWCLSLIAIKWLILVGLGFGLNSALNLPLETALLVAFALSFSSTIGVIKLLEDQDELKTKHGNVAVGILVIQDILAVIFLAVATGQIPTIWAALLLLFIPAKPLINRLVKKAGHGELLPLTGFVLALGASEIFALVNIKADLGALCMGILLANTHKATELYKSLIIFKDLFLVGFFLLIGLSALPTAEMLVTALSISTLLIFKFLLFWVLFLFFRMRPRNAFLSAITLSSFSEFGLIVVKMAVSKSMIDDEWLVIIALAVTFSLIISSIISKFSHSIYARHKVFINSLQWPGQQVTLVLNTSVHAKILVIGLGRVGTATYDSLAQTSPGSVIGIEADEDRAKRHQQAGREVITGDGEDADFWAAINLTDTELIMLSTPSVLEMMFIIEQIRLTDFKGKIVCIARFDDERQQLLDGGADVVFSYFAEVGNGFAEEGKRLLSNNATA
ncbi:cation:proton antiporter family protein [Oceanicoccus sagamiensis]|uniref:Uncharacterized protein n=1 Tax=Oceanicoccus sagamiensis TaxID=716816 RepID=A0A1X9NFK7_9GAMM|nr:cation:proton antiporter family protein [Oceanicoccus sagamiensis]ARN75824.1 hypothetical protein BST96_17965 [Oceanicoccus sagamiensis]